MKSGHQILPGTLMSWGYVQLLVFDDGEQFRLAFMATQHDRCLGFEGACRAAIGCDSAVLRI